MSAYVEHDFEKSFILDEARVRKIHELISTRVAKLPEPPKLLLKVFRGDSYVYETPHVSDVLKEDNDDWRAITRLEFIANTEDVFYLRLTFSSRGTFINLMGDDRDTVFLIFSDLREYLHSSVLTRAMIGRDATRMIGLLSMVVAMVGLFWSLFASMLPDPEVSSRALNASDVGEKINYLIEERSRQRFPTSMFGWLALTVLATLGAVSGAIEGLWRLLFPGNLFLFGKRKELHDKRRAALSKVFWVVFVGLAVSILGGMLLNWGNGAA